MSNKGQTKYTYEFVKSEFEKCGYELLSKEYIRCDKKLEYICSKHKEEGILTITFSKFMKGQRCRFCAKENTPNARVSDDILKEYCDKLDFQFIKSHMINNQTHVDFVCNNHQEKGIQTTRVGNLKRMNGCKYCCGKGKTTEDFKNELHKINPNIIVLGEYINAITKIRCKCIIDETEWEATPNSLLRPEGCPTCALKNLSIIHTISNDEFLKHLQNINPYIEILSKYTGTRDGIKCKCKIDGYEWTTFPNSLLYGKSKCPECTRQKLYKSQAKTNDQFLKELKIINPDILPLEQYYSGNTKLKCKCLIHNYEWYVTPTHILNRKTGCPKCTRYTNEVKLHEIFKKYNILYISQKRYKNCKDKNTLPFDFYLKEYNVLVEYDGEGHYIPIRRGHMTDENALENLNKVKLHDQIKNEYCKTQNIPLIRIPYWERDNMECFLFDELSKLNINIKQENQAS